MARKKLSILLTLIVISAIITSILVSPGESILAAQNALNLCASALLPSLFPFFVFSGLLISTGIAEIAARRFKFIMKPLFGVSGAGAVCFVLGIISGYPLGAVCAGDLYKQGITSKTESERLLTFCNNSGPLFILGSVGTAIYQSPNLGRTLYITHIISAILVGIIFKFYLKNERFTTQNHSISVHNTNLGKSIITVMQSSLKNILLICGFTVVFSVIISSLSRLGGIFASPLLSGILEISSGISNIASSEYDFLYKIVFTSFVLGFGGISVHLQVFGVLSESGLSFKPYIIGKLLQGLLSAFIIYVILSLSGESINVFASDVYPVTMGPLTLLGALKLSCWYLGMTAVSIVIMLIVCRNKK